MSEIHSPDGSWFIAGAGVVRGRSRWEVWVNNVHDSTHFRREDARVHIRKIKLLLRPAVCPCCHGDLKSVMPPNGIITTCYWCGCVLNGQGPSRAFLEALRALTKGEDRGKYLVTGVPS